MEETIIRKLRDLQEDGELTPEEFNRLVACHRALSRHTTEYLIDRIEKGDVVNTLLWGPR